MIYPSVLLIEKNKKILFHNNTYELSDFHISQDHLFSHVDKGWTILVIAQNLKNLTYLKRYLIGNKIQNIVFLIDDVFRLNYHDPAYTWISTKPVEQNFKNSSFYEIDIIKDILKSCNIKKYKTYHCEKIPSKLKKSLGLKIDYYDLFLKDWTFRFRDLALEIPNDYNFNYTVSCLNHRADIHRTLITSLFCENPKFFYTTCSHLDYDYLLNNEEISVDKFDDEFKKLIKSKVRHFYKKPLIKLDDKLIKNYNNEYYSFKTQNNVLNYLAIQDSFVNLTNETRFYTSLNYISEKSFKPIIARRPFIMVGPAGNLAMLKNWGFKTFDKWWDESYDLETNHNERIKKIYELITYILSLDKDTLVKMLEEMNSILDYNYQLYLKFDSSFYEL
jgi:hypothetical protein